jgi:DNA-directed RNA polymerase subunit M/transcription elongation factor TFIIS
MDDIEREPIKSTVRQRWVKTLINVFKEKKRHFEISSIDKENTWNEKEIQTYCKKLEEHIQKNTYKIENNNGQIIYKYKSNVLFSFESNEKHKFLNLQSYLKSINLVFSILTFIPYNKIPKDFLGMFDLTDKELSSYSGHAKWLRDYIEREKKSKLIYNEKSSEKGIFNCPKCKSFKIEMEEKQTRSADEPMTIYCKCEECETTFIK